MGWGYFLDAHLELPTETWSQLAAKKTDEFPTSVGWWAMKDPVLERRFVDMFGDTSKGMTFAKLVKYFAGRESIGTVTTEGGRATVRIVTLLSKDMDTDIARGVAALFEAARDARGAGHVSLANDGTYVGEDGVTVTLANGKLTRKAIKDSWAHTEQLAREIFGDEVFEDEGDDDDDAPPKKAVTKKAATKKAATKKAATKKAATKKAATKKAAPKKAATKKAATKKAATKKAAPKKTPTKKTPTKNQR